LSRRAMKKAGSLNMAVTLTARSTIRRSRQLGSCRMRSWRPEMVWTPSSQARRHRRRLIEARAY